MSKPATAKLTSEERCRKAFDSRIWTTPVIGLPNDMIREILYHGWQACWRYLEARVTEFVGS